MTKHFLKCSLLAPIFLFISISAFPEIKLPALFTDNMVLQQKASDPVWGWATPGAEITVSGSWPGAASVRTKADDQGKWQLRVRTPAAGGPFTLTVKGDQTIVLHNVLIGEVWVCSGQSNMEMPVSGWPGASLLRSAEEIKAASYPEIRLFTVKKDIALEPQADCTGSWAECTPETVASFSATAYFFGRQLFEQLKVPIGLIHTSWGGTVAEAWTSSSALRKLGDFDQSLDHIDSLLPHLKTMQADYDQKLALWNKDSKTVRDEYARADFDAGSWKSMKLPVYWENAGYPDLDGVVWFRKTVDIPAAWAGKPLKLDLGPVDDEDITFFNGQKVGGYEQDGFWGKNRSYDVPADLVKAGTCVIAVRVTDLQGNGGIYGDAKLMNLYPADGKPSGGVSLAGDWKFKVDVVKPIMPVASNPNTPTVLYNGMIAPVIPFGIRGAIWYQGEANVGRAAQYAKLFPTMITDWRTRWNEGNFPFYFVQIAPFPYGGDSTGAAALRDAQRRSLTVPNTGMVVTLDIGNVKNIHPANKQEVGRRLSLWALSHTYGKKGLAYSGPLYQSMQVKGNKIIVSFTHTAGGLVAKGGDLTWFEVAGPDGRFMPATAIIRGDQVEVSAAGVPHPQQVRYGWKDTAEPHLFNKAGLPASSFSTQQL